MILRILPFSVTFLGDGKGHLICHPLIPFYCKKTAAKWQLSARFHE
jgi:hypothetical protein